MSHQLVNHSPDLLKLRNEGYEIEVRDAFLLVHSIPYVNQNAEVKLGTLVSELTLSGDQTTKPGSHTIYFIGEHPCNKDGSEIAQIKHQSSTQKLAEGLVVNHSFSGRPYDKPSKEFDDYYEKITRYVGVISAPARFLDKSVSPKTFKVIESTDEESVFNYLDTNSSRAEITHISDKLKSQKVGIIGVGGTGSYVLDFLAKTPVSEIHLFDDDEFLQHNAFRAPGAASITELQEKARKVTYHQRNYSKMRKNIFAHEVFLTEENLDQLADLTFVFLCLDKAEMKKFIVAKLEQIGIPFIDVGMGLTVVDDKLIAIIRTTSSASHKRDHVREKTRISFDDPEGDPDYLTNIQIAELNGLNAAFAVIWWKKFLGFYQDSKNEFHSTYTLNANLLLSEETYEA